MYDGANPVLELTNGNPTSSILTGLLIDEVFSRTEASGTSTFLMDAAGSTVEQLDATGLLQTHYSYEPYGRTNISGTLTTNATQFTGRENDGTGMYNYRARYYIPDIGRFTSQDPIGFNGGLNLYEYAADNPIMNWDSLGLKISCGTSGIQERFVGSCPSGKAACTDARMVATAGPCRQDSNCGTWAFDANVDLRFTITYLRPKNSRSGDTPRATLEEHEKLHIADLQEWCTGLSAAYPSEGFRTLGECTAARNTFMREVQRSFRQAQEDTRRKRDRY